MRVERPATVIGVSETHPLPKQTKEQIRANIILGSRLDLPYLIMNALATFVACYGLLSNSTAVVIGAMIIAMLLGPIMGLGLALVDGDNQLLKNALLAELIGAGLVLLIGIVIGKIHSDIPLTYEILSRTKPNLLDLMVALGGGAAGAYATVSPRLSVGLVGVAISTALVPPLASCGICLAHWQLHLAGGAFLLFITNLVAIQCASSAVLFGFGYHKVIRKEHHDPAYFWRILLDVGVLALLAFFLFFRLSASVNQEIFEAMVKKTIVKGLMEIPGSYLTDTRFKSSDGADVVVAVVNVPNSITPAQAAKIEAMLPKMGNRRIELHIRSVLTKEVTAKGYLQIIDPSAHPADDLRDPDSDAATTVGPGATPQAKNKARSAVRAPSEVKP